MLDANPAAKASPHRISRQQAWRYTLGALGAVLILAGVWQSHDRYAATHAQPILPSAAPETGARGTNSAAQPSETKPHSNFAKTYTVPADQPRSIRISSIGVSGFVQAVSTTKDNAIAVPSNIYFAGWYTDSVKPTQPGLTIIDGHVTGRFADGIFKQLAKVKNGSDIEVELGSGVVKKYLVIDQKTLPDDQAADYLFTKRADITSQLNLITCGGEFNRAKGRYNDRVIVVAKAID